jgi:thiol-disulfide isomerase/thioredoxin
MNRRRLLTTVAGVGLTGGSAWVLTRSGPSEDQFPMTVETVDARGSAAGQTRLPVAETVTVVDLFATWCTPCTEQLETMAPLVETYGPDVAFVSVTNERLGGTFQRSDLRAWWRSHEGNWTVGLDPESDVMAAIGASGLPHIAVFDRTGHVTFAHSGVADEETLREQIREALDES